MHAMAHTPLPGRCRASCAEVQGLSARCPARVWGNRHLGMGKQRGMRPFRVRGLSVCRTEGFKSSLQGLKLSVLDPAAHAAVSCIDSALLPKYRTFDKAWM